VKVTFSDDGWDDYLYWQAQDRKILKRINLLIEDVVRNENTGIGKPEPLRHEWAGWWSRRITQEHRLVYRLGDDAVEIAVCRFHYGR
jgi:toxin YoeB